MRIKDFLRNKYFKFGFAATLYTLWVIWIDYYWLLPGLGIIYDYYISKKVNWTFWKKRNQKNSTIIEWLDALIFAVIAVTFINIFFFQNYKIPTGSMEKTLLKGDHLFVSKLSFGPRIPQTPLHFPFTQHTMPIIKTKSYVEWIKFPYKRLPGLREIKNNDIVVFNFPAGDTVVLQDQARSYKSIVREYALKFKLRDRNKGENIRKYEYYWHKARNFVWSQYDIVVRPVDRRDNYIKRCVGIPGDTLLIDNTQLYINGQKQKEIKNIQFSYRIVTNGGRLNPLSLERIGIPAEDLTNSFRPNEYECVLTEDNLEDLKAFRNVVAIQKNVKPDSLYDYQIFPHDPRYPWNVDNFGPLWVPQKGATIKLTLDNLPLYGRIIDVYERNNLEVKDSVIYINGEPTDTYTFKMGYYWMMGDNRHRSSDSRYWGFVPDNHIVGAPVFIWLSIDKTASFLDKIRWNRLFKGAKR
jgi:signal peptidase I